MKMERNRDCSVILSLGSNLGDKQKNIERAVEKIDERIGRVISLSALHVTTPVGFHSRHLFVNCVCEVVTDVDVHSLFVITQEIEREMGRGEKSVEGVYADRLIDIDLILVGDLIVKSPDLTIPHPRFHLRDFVLAPLCEIAPERLHPVNGKSMGQLKKELERGDPSAQ